MKHRKTIIVTGWIVMVIISYLFKPHSHPPLPLPILIKIGWAILVTCTIMISIVKTK